MNKKIILAGLLSLSAIGCEKGKIEISDVLTEHATIESKKHTTEEQEKNSWYAVGEPAIAESIVGDSYVVRINGEIDFEIKDQDLFEKVNVGDKVIVEYEKVFRVYSDGDKEFKCYKFKSAKKLE